VITLDARPPMPNASTSVVVAVLNPKGGAGKTTVAVHLARAFQGMMPAGGGEGASPVVVLDTDPQGTASDWRRASPDEYDGPPVVPVASARDLRSVVATHEADVLVIDGSAKLEGMTGAAADVADVVVIPVQPSALDVWGASEAVAVVRRAGTPGAFVISRAVVGSRLARQVRAALDAYDLPVMDARTSARVAFTSAMGEGQTVLDTAPGSKAAAEVEALAREVAALLDPDA
jgi:chromosome partitioning protein